MFKKIFKETPSLEGLKLSAIIQARHVLKKRKFHWRVQFLFTFMLILCLGFLLFIIYDITVFNLKWWLPLPFILVSAIIGYLTARIYKLHFQGRSKVIMMARMDWAAIFVFVFYLGVRFVTNYFLEGYYHDVYVARGIIAATLLGVIAGRFLGVVQMIDELHKKKS